MSKKKNKSNKVSKPEAAPVVESEVVTPVLTPEVKDEVKDEVKEVEVVKITSTDIKIISNADLNFKSLKLKKGEELVVSDSVLTELPNLAAFIDRGVIKFVK